MYFLGGKSCDAFVQRVFFLGGFFLVFSRARNGVTIVVVVYFRHGSSMLWELVFKYFVA